MAVSNDKFTMETPNTETLGALAGQLATLLKVGKRTDGKLHPQDLANGDINRWAKFKFVRHSHTFNQSDTWKAADGWCGLSIENALISNTTDVSGIENFFTGDKNNGWEYLRPRGIAHNEMIRLRDMDGYNHNVLPFVSGYSMPNTWAKTDGAFQVSFRITISGEDKADFLSYQDLPLENYYLGMALVGNGKVYRCTNSTTIESSGMNVTFDISNVADGDYVAYPFMSNKVMKVNDGGFVAAKVYALPNCASSLLTIVDNAIAIQIQGTYADFTDANGYYSLSYTVKVTNNTQLEKAFSNNYIQLRYGGKKFTDTLLADEKSKQLSDFTVAAGATKTLSGFFSSIIPALQSNSIIWVSLSSSLYLKSAVPQQNINPDM